MLVKILAEALYLRTSSGTFTDRTSPTFFDGVTSSVSDTDRTVSDVRVGNVAILSSHGAQNVYPELLTADSLRLLLKMFFFSYCIFFNERVVSVSYNKY